MKEQEKIINKIKKCLALSKSSNANERATALRQAQALMQKHGLQDLDIQAAQAGEDKAKASVKNKPGRWETNLAITCGKAFGCDSLFSRTLFGDANWTFIGVDLAPELSAYAFEVLLRQLKRDRSNYIKTALKRCKKANKTARADEYCENWIYAVHQTVKGFVGNQAHQEAIQAYMQKYYPDATDLVPRQRKSTATADASWKDSRAGSADGQNANLSRGVNQAKSTGLEAL